MNTNLSHAGYSMLMTVYVGTDAAELRESLVSMINQTISPAEYIVVADGPLTQPVEDELASFFQTAGQEKCKLVRLPENHGAGFASGAGIPYCSYEYIARMDSDDISLPDRVAKQLDIMRSHQDYAAVGCWAREFITDEGAVSTVELPVEPDAVARYARRRCPVRHPCLLLRKSMLEQIGGYRDIRFAEEWDIINRFLQAGYRCYNIPEVLVKVRVGKDFYARRGGMENARRILGFKWQMLKNRQTGLVDFLISESASAIVCFMPNALRGFVYGRLLRKRPSAGHFPNEDAGQ